MTDGDSECSSSGDVPHTPEWISHGGFILLILGVVWIFWGMAFICEEYCVPSISVFCKRNKISEDVAGAIFIGTGLSLPVLFASFVGLFIQNTAIGVGTVVGGDVFNHLMNIAFSIYVAPGRQLRLDGVVFTREMIFYFISCLFVIWSVHENLFDSLRTAFSHEQWVSCISIPWQSSLVLIASYVAYCLIDAYFDRISLYFQPMTVRLNVWLLGSLPPQRYTLAPANNLEDIVDVVANNYLDIECEAFADPFFLTFDNYRTEQLTYRGNRQHRSGSTDYNQSQPVFSHHHNSHRPAAEDVATSVHRLDLEGKESEEEGEQLQPPVGFRNFQDLSQHNNRRFVLIPSTTCEDPLLYPSASHPTEQTSPQQQQQQHPLPSVSDPLENTIDETYASLPFSQQLSHPAAEVDIEELFDHFLLFLRSTFYTIHDFGCVPTSRKWKARYFRLSEQGLFYKLAFHLPFEGQHVRYIDLFDLEKISVENPDCFEFSLQIANRKKKYYFQAPNQLIYELVLRRLYRFQQENQLKTSEELRDLARKAIASIGSDIDSIVEPDSESIGDTMFVVPSPLFLRGFHYFTLPKKLLLYLTIPDVRRQGCEGQAMLSIGISFVWLALLTYLLVEILSVLSNLLGVNATVMGMTVGAWATSYPAVWSSVVVARSGFGNVAVCNALGSIIFSNYLGLGLPWFVYSMAYQQPYSGLQDQGVAFSILVLMFVLIATYFVIAMNRFVLDAWMIPLFTIVYLGYIGYFSFFILTL